MLIGSVGSEPIIRDGEKGKFATFSLATKERFKNRDGGYTENTEWHNIVAYGNLATLVEKYITKSSKLYVEGKLHYRSYTNNEGVKRDVAEIILSLVDFLDSRKDGGSNGRTPNRGGDDYDF